LRLHGARVAAIQRKAGVMAQGSVIPHCAECEARWLPADDEHWRAHLTNDEEIVFCCRECAHREFGDE
jgi:hypothetical protein